MTTNTPTINTPTINDYPVMPRALRVDTDRMLRDMFAAAGDPPAVLAALRDHAGRLDPDDRLALTGAALLDVFAHRLPALLPDPNPTREDTPDV